MPAVESAAPALFVSGVVDDPEFVEPAFAEPGVVFWPAIGAHGSAFAAPAGGVAGEDEGVAVLPEVEFPFVVEVLPLVLGWPFCWFAPGAFWVCGAVCAVPAE